MNRHYVLLATDGYISLPVNSDIQSDKRKRVYVFGFAGGLYKVYDEKSTVYVNKELDIEDAGNYKRLMSRKGTASIPSPVIWGEVGDNIYVSIINLGMDVSGINTIHFHGGDLLSKIDEITEEGTGVRAWTCIEKKPECMTYCFNPTTPGSYMYHCHADGSSHVQMGMYGAIIIYPSYSSLKENGIEKDYMGRWFSNGSYCENIPRTSTNRNFAYNSINSYFDKENIILLSDIDTNWHECIERGITFDTVKYNPNYWLINGKAYPDTVEKICSAKAGSDEPQVDYESCAHIKNGDLLLLRVMNIGYQMVPWHINGYHFYIIGKDAAPSPFLAISQLIDRGNTKISVYDMFEKGYTASIGSGETYDLLISSENRKNSFDDRSISKFYPMHNYDDYKIVNNGVYPGGQLTYIQVDE